MKFGEKIRTERNKLNLSQQELAKKLGVSLRTITNYETANMYPKKREIYTKLAEVFNVDINYLLTENEEFVITAQEQYGAKGAKQANDLVNQMGALFAGGELTANDKDAVMRALQEIYWESKEENKKYTPKKYLDQN
ncbi:MAG: XRE family transcriptional regulator [Clostridia bacterium]